MLRINQKETLKNKALKPATKRVENKVMYNAELMANEYDLLKLASPIKTTTQIYTLLLL